MNKKRQSVDANIKVNQVLELSEKDFKEVINCFNDQLQILLKQMENRKISKKK